MAVIPEDLDFLVARIHGRRSRMAEAERLDALCRLRSLEDLARAVLPERETHSVPEFQRRVVEDWLGELEVLARGLSLPRARMLEALANRLQVEDLKLLVRGLAAGLPPESLRSRLVRPPRNPALASVQSLEDFAALLQLPENLKNAAAPHRPFLLETSLDHGYVQGLLAALQGLDPEDRTRIRSLIHQEVDHFHLMLVVRGRFFHGLEADVLLPWHLEGTGITRRTFTRMLSAPDLWQAAGRARRLALDVLPSPERLDPALLEALAWNRFLRLACRTFRQGPMDFGTLVGYAALRRAEVANLITLSEGIRLGMSGDAIRARLAPRSGLEAACA